MGVMWKLWENRPLAFGMFGTTTRLRKSMTKHNYHFTRVTGVCGKCDKLITRTMSASGRSEH